MFSGKAEVRISPDDLHRAIQAKVAEAQRWLDERVAKDSDPFVPMDTGMLAGSVRESGIPGSGVIVYNTPYAHRLYCGESFNFSRDRHPKATHHWFEKAKSIFLESWGQGVAAIIGGAWRRA